MLIASVTFSHAAYRKRGHKRGTHLDELPTSYMSTPEHEDWNTESFESGSIETNEDDDDNLDDISWTEEQHQPSPKPTWNSNSGWNGNSGWNANSGWNSNTGSGWQGNTWSSSPDKYTKTIVKKIPIPYERPIQIENPIYTPIAKHIPIERPVPVVKYIEKRVPMYVDHPIATPILKEEHVPKPYDQKVRVILQKVYVHVPAPPAKQHTVIIRKKLGDRNNQSKKRRFLGWL